MAGVDAAAIAGGTSGYELMRRAGAAATRVVRRELALAGGGAVTVCAGPGNNGGDGAVVAAELARGGVDVALVRAGGEPSGDAARAFADCDVATLEGAAAHARIAASAVVVDALFGAGLSRAPADRFAELIAAVNGGAGRIVAIDLPSGLDGNAHVAHEPCVRADATVTFVRLKPAHLLEPGRTLCGRLELADIGMPDAALASARVDAWANVPAAWRAAVRPPGVRGHKYARGHVLVRAGDAASGGAARLSASAALRCGAGLVTLACPGSATLVNAAHLNAVMLARADGADGWAELFAGARYSTLLVGPGNGVDEATREAVLRALASHRDCVLDADALTSHGARREEFFEGLRACGGQVVLTPHAGEFDRLFEGTEAVTGPSKLHRARAAAALCGATVLLKGPDTVVATPDGRASIGINAPPWLATAGSGDVLAGIVAALLAQGMPAFEAASAGVWLHGDAARAQGWPLTAQRLVEAAGEALRRCVPASAPDVPEGLQGGF